MLSQAQLDEFRENGFLIVPEFLSEDEVNSMENARYKLVAEMNLSEHAPTVFSTIDHTQARSRYFLDSGDKIHFFFEPDALDSEGNMKVDKHLALNKIGHAIHWWVPEFKEASFSPKVARLAKQLLFKDPAIVQSMYIFKQPGFGGEVVPHKDSTFLSTEPQSCVGLWFALEDAQEDNGCLWFEPGSHLIHTKRRFIRNPDPNGPLTIFTHSPDEEDLSKYISAPVKKGSLIIIHGSINHMSFKNTSEKSRHIYTFHVIETERCDWLSDNWLQPTEKLPFTKLYENVFKENKANI